MADIERMEGIDVDQKVSEEGNEMNGFPWGLEHGSRMFVQGEKDVSARMILVKLISVLSAIREGALAVI